MTTDIILFLIQKKNHYSKYKKILNALVTLNTSLSLPFFLKTEATYLAALII
jgi:hypothetical protein